MKNIHIGELIKQKFEERRRVDKSLTKASFARQINIHRSTLYLLFAQKSIDIELLMNISKVLNYDFIENVYLDKKPIKKNRIILGVEVDAEQLRKLDLPDHYIQMVSHLTIK